MAQEILSMAILEALPGKQEELLATLRELYTMMHSKGYCRDSLHCDSSRPDRFLHLRRWTSPRCAAKRKPILTCIATGKCCRSCAPSRLFTRA